MFPTNAVFFVQVILGIFSLVTSYLMKVNDEQIKHTSVFKLNLLVFGRAFGLAILLSALVYLIFTPTNSTLSDQDALLWFVICELITVVVLLVQLLPLIRQRCPNCGYWGKAQPVGLRTVQVEGRAVMKQADTPQGVTATQEKVCNHCGNVWGGAF
jgi:hypothetical protein